MGFGEFCQTLDLTCVATGWTECRVVKNKAQRWFFEALLDIEASLPFPCSAWTRTTGARVHQRPALSLLHRARHHLTRSRPYRKNDNCFVEQKNWPVVRQNVGCARYDKPAELAVLDELYALLRLYLNFFQPR